MSRKILIVEDSCELREMLGTVLAARGWNPITGNHSHGHADAGYERLRARDDFKKASCLQEHTHTCGDRVSRPYRPAAMPFGRLR